MDFGNVQSTRFIKSIERKPSVSEWSSTDGPIEFEVELSDFGFEWLAERFKYFVLYDGGVGEGLTYFWGKRMIHLYLSVRWKIGLLWCISRITGIKLRFYIW